MELEAELVRCRERLHKLEAAVQALRYRADSVQEWRSRIDPIVSELRETDRIAAEVARKMKEQTSFHLTTVQRRVAYAAGGFAILGGAAAVAQAVASFFQ